MNAALVQVEPAFISYHGTLRNFELSLAYPGNTAFKFCDT